jgi:hypothetical protein
MRSDTPHDPFGRPLDEQLRALGRELDEAAPPVEPSELADATPTAEVAHLVAVDPDATTVIPLIPVPPMADDVPPRRRRGRGLAVAAAALAVVAAGGAAAALAGGDDEVRTDQAALRPVSEPAQEAAEEPAVDLGGFGEVADAFATCMEAGGFSVEAPGGEGFGSFEELAALVADPAFFETMRECTASSGLADLDLGAELEGLDLEGRFEEQFGGAFDESFEGMFEGMLDDVLAEVEGIDMAEVGEQLDQWLAELGEEAPAFGEELREHAAMADRIRACMEDRGWSLEDPPAFDDRAAHEQLFADLRACTEQG